MYPQSFEYCLDSQGECSLDPLKKLVVEIIAFLSTLGSLETDSG